MSDEESTQRNTETKGQRLARWNRDARAAGLTTGRPRGVPNKLTARARTELLDCFDGIGGAEAFQAWARKHRAQFYALFFKAIPREREANALGTGVTIVLRTADDMRPPAIDVTPDAVAE